MEELTAAGYEAYNVTGENYSALEEALRTDFGDMGLDPNGSYIIVISGEDPVGTNNSTRGSDLLLPPHAWDDPTPDGDTNEFIYQYDGKNYKMRYLTVTGDINSGLITETLYRLDQNQVPETVGNWLMGVFTYLLSESTGVLADVFSVIYDNLDDDNLMILNSNTSWIYAATAWTHRFIEVEDANTGQWRKTQYVTMANISGEITISVYNQSTGFMETVHIPVSQTTLYSPFYNQKEVCKRSAVTAYITGSVSKDRLHQISFHYIPPSDVYPDGTIVHNQSDSQALFIHYQPNIL